MNSTEQQTIEVIINGQQAGKTIKEQEANVRKLTAEWRKAEIGSKEYIEGAKKISEANKILDTHKNLVRNTSDAMQQFGRHAANTQGAMGGLIQSLRNAGSFTGALSHVLGISKQSLDDARIATEHLVQITQAASAARKQGVKAVVEEVGAVKAATIGQKLWTFVVGETTGAMKLLRIAIASTGIGLLVIGLGVLIANYKEIGNVLGFNVNPATKKLAEETEKATEASEKALKAFDLEEKKLRLLGAAEEDLINLRKGETQKHIDQLNKQIDVQEQIIENTKKQKELDAENPFLNIPLLGGATSDEDIKAAEEKLQMLKEKRKEFGVDILELTKKEEDLEDEANKKKEEKRKKLQEKEQKEREKIVASTKKMLDDLQTLQAQAIKDEQEREEALLLDKFSKDKRAIEEEVGNENVKNQNLLALNQKYVIDLAALKKKAADDAAKKQKEEADAYDEQQKKDGEKYLEREARKHRASLELAVLTTKEGSKKRLEAEEALLVDRMNKELEIVGITEEEKALIREKYRQEEAKKDRAAAIKTAEEIISFTKQASGFILQIVSNREQESINLDKKTNDARKIQLKHQFEAGLISKEQYETEVAKIDEEHAEKVREIKRKAFERQKRAAVIEAIINTAVSIAKVVYNPILAAAAAILGGLQVAAIESQPVPEFAKGTILSGGRSHSQGGMPIINPNTGRKVYEIENGEAIIPTSTTASNLPLIHALLASNGRSIMPWISSMPAAVNYGGMTSTARRFAEGGIFGGGGSVNPSSGSGTADASLLIAALNANTNASLMLINRLNEPIEARYGNGEVRRITDLQDQFSSLRNNASI